jgi:hypothetical protein
MSEKNKQELTQLIVVGVLVLIAGFAFFKIKAWIDTSAAQEKAAIEKKSLEERQRADEYRAKCEAEKKAKDLADIEAEKKALADRARAAEQAKKAEEERLAAEKKSQEEAAKNSASNADSAAANLQARQAAITKAQEEAKAKKAAATAAVLAADDKTRTDQLIRWYLTVGVNVTQQYDPQTNGDGNTLTVAGIAIPAAPGQGKTLDNAYKQFEEARRVRIMVDRVSPEVLGPMTTIQSPDNLKALYSEIAKAKNETYSAMENFNSAKNSMASRLSASIGGLMRISNEFVRYGGTGFSADSDMSTMATDTAQEQAKEKSKYQSAYRSTAQIGAEYTKAKNQWSAAFARHEALSQVLASITERLKAMNADVPSVARASGGGGGVIKVDGQEVGGTKHKVYVLLDGREIEVVTEAKSDNTFIIKTPDGKMVSFEKTDIKEIKNVASN